MQGFDADDFIELEERVSDLEEQGADTNKKVNDLHQLMWSDGEGKDRVNTRNGVDDLRLMREIYNKFKSVRFLFGAFVGVVSFLGTVGYGVYKALEIIKVYFKGGG